MLFANYNYKIDGELHCTKKKRWGNYTTRFLYHLIKYFRNV